ncbi:MAG: NfeD family protein [Steroidobacteraceae bacterium]
MIELMMRLEWWHWWIAAAVLGAAEAFIPGAVAIWFAAAAAVLGAVLLILPIPWQLQPVLFGLLSFGALAAWRYYKRSHPETSDLPMLNRRSEQYRGQVYELSEPIAQGFGKVKIGDGYWKVRGPDLPAGSKVRVTGSEGVLLIVEPA